MTKTEPLEPHMIYLPPAIWGALDKQAQTVGIRRSEFVRQYLIGKAMDAAPSPLPPRAPFVPDPESARKAELYGQLLIEARRLGWDRARLEAKFAQITGLARGAPSTVADWLLALAAICQEPTP